MFYIALEIIVLRVDLQMIYRVLTGCEVYGLLKSSVELFFHQVLDKARLKC